MSPSKNKLKMSCDVDNNDHFYFPEEIVVEILARLPTKSLVRFMTVDKSWYSLIQCPKFTHTRLSKKKPQNLLLFHFDYFFNLNKYCIKKPAKRAYSLRYDDDDCRYLPEHYKKCGKYTHIYGASNGLICLSERRLINNERFIILTNPTIRRQKRLPPSPISFDVRRNDEYWQVALSFGYMPNINDYTVILIVTHKQQLHFNNSVSVAIYSLRTNSWKRVDDDDLVGTDHLGHVVFPRYYDNSLATFVDGAAYWIVDSGVRVLCFDVVSKMFRLIPLPVLDYDAWLNWKRLTHGYSIYAFGESLAVCLRVPDRLYVWVLDVHGGHVWKQYLTTTLSSTTYSMRNPIGLRTNGDLLIQKDDDRSIVSFNCATREAKDFWKLGGPHGDVPPTYISPFVETLVLLDDRTWRCYDKEWTLPHILECPISNHWLPSASRLMEIQAKTNREK